MDINDTTIVLCQRCEKPLGELENEDPLEAKWCRCNSGPFCPSCLDEHAFEGCPTDTALTLSDIL